MHIYETALQKSEHCFWQFLQPLHRSVDPARGSSARQHNAEVCQAENVRCITYGTDISFELEGHRYHPHYESRYWPECGRLILYQRLLKDRRTPTPAIQPKSLNGNYCSENGHSAECSLHRRPKHCHGTLGRDDLGEAAEATTIQGEEESIPLVWWVSFSV